jgi:ACT domain-containing protein
VQIYYIARINPAVQQDRKEKKSNHLINENNWIIRKKMRAVITVLGNDRIGIIYHITSVLVQYNVNILDISQTILQGFFSMVMVVDLSGCDVKFEQLQSELEKKGVEIGLSVRIQHEDIFNSMHQI